LIDIDVDRIELLAVTSAPSVTEERPMRPVIGAVMRA
jgi:hypothetical protein